jgi:hypothetical protein
VSTGSTRRLALSIGVFTLGILVSLVAVAYVFRWISDERLRLPEIILTLVLVIGVVALISTLAGLVALLRAFGLASGTEALGLPPGSVRAILALMLVLIFAITSIFLYYNSVRGGTTSAGITAEQISLLPKDRIVSIRAVPGPSGGPAPSPAVFDVDLQASAASEQLAQQLITLIGTLLTAVAAFYFGSSSVVTALKARTSADGSGPMDASTAGVQAASDKAVLAAAQARYDRSEALRKALETVDEAVPPAADTDIKEG